MRNLCIIPARGGSRRIPGKNIKDFLGKPIIAYSIEVALESNLFDVIMVSTDDKEIGQIAKNYGAQVPFFRSFSNSDDSATTVDVILEVIKQYQLIGQAFKNVCCLYPTAPFVSVEKLNQGLEKLNQGKFDTIFPVVAFSYPVWRGLEFTDSGKISMLWKQYQSARSQDLPEVFHDAGQWYWATVEKLSFSKQLFTENTTSIILNPLEVQDIDNLTDWKLAEIKYEYLQSVKHPAV